MRSATSKGSSNTAEGASLSTAELASQVQSLTATIEALKQQLEWFKRQVFGSKSERYVSQPDPAQMYLGESFPAPAALSEQRKVVPEHTRRVAQRDRPKA